MHRKELAYMALAVVTGVGLVSVLFPAPPSAREQRERASWYGPGFAGRPTAQSSPAHPIDELPWPHSVQEEAFDMPESRYADPRSYADPTRSASFPTEVKDVVASFATASGERFSPQALTDAHRSLPLGTRARVTNLETGQQVEVTINDCGPFADPERRVLDTPRPRPRRAAQVARASRRPVSAKRNPEKPQQLPPPAPGPWVVASRPAAPGASARIPTADHGPLDCRVTPKICLDGD